MYIYIYTHAQLLGVFPALQCTKRVPIPNQMLLQRYIQLGKSTKVLGNIRIPPLLNSTFRWEDQQMY